MSDDHPPTQNPTTSTDDPSPPSPGAGRSVVLEVEVDGTPDDVWRAIATGPGISSWYVPHQVDERAGGAALASFGPGPEMQIAGRVAAWEPPHRIVFDGGDGVGGLAFEWTVEARSGGRCVVRLVNSGFGEGAEWDAQYDGMAEGWQLFLLNLGLHLQYFSGRTATSLLPMATWVGARDDIWQRLSDHLGIPASPQIGKRIEIGPGDGPRLAGTLVDAAAWRIALVVDSPAPGTAFVAVEGGDDGAMVSVWAYLYGDGSEALAVSEGARWQEWLDTAG